MEPDMRNNNALFKRPQTLPACPSDKCYWDEGEYVGLVEWYWSEKTEYSEENQSLSHILHHKSHMHWLEIETGPTK